MLKPLPCPFCGSAPKLYPTDPEREGNAWGVVRCENKQCPTYDVIARQGVEVGDGLTIADERGSDKYKEAAIKRWNRRP